MRVLVVDDDSIHLLILKKIFENAADDVVLAKNGFEALHALEDNSDFHIILTDIVMPQMDGLELLAEIKRRDNCCKIPIIGFTSGDVEYYRNSSREKFDVLVPKPMDFWDLYDLAKEKATKHLN